MKGLVAVPVHNEAHGLRAVVEELKRCVPVGNLLFVNDGSTDESERVLRESGVRYVSHPVNLGYQEALKTGMLWALNGEHEYVVFFDSDGQHRTEDLRSIINAHDEHGYDLIIGTRYQNHKGFEISARSLGTWLFSRLVTSFVGVKITDATCGLKLVSRPFLPVAMQLPAEDMHAEFIIGMAWCGARVHEEPIEVLPRTGGDSMYSLYRALLYPIKTFLVLLVGFSLSKRLRSLDRGEGSDGGGDAGPRPQRGRG